MTKPRDAAVRFAELFAGVGLFRLGLEKLGWRCAFANDISPDKAEIYARNFGKAEFVLGDVAKVTADAIPPVDVLTASFPCQDISLAGKRMGLAGSRSSTFFEFTRILGELVGQGRGPRAVVVENVVGLLTSNGGADVATVLAELNRLGYRCDLLLLDAASFLPQSRPRVFILGIEPRLGARVPDATHPARSGKVRKVIEGGADVDWGFLELGELPALGGDLRGVIDHSASAWFDQPALERELSYVRGLSQGRLERARARAALLRRPVYLTGYRRMRGGLVCLELRDDGLAGCLRTPGGGSSRQILVEVSECGVRMRFMISREYARLQGVADTFWIPENQTKGLQAFGDGVAVPVVEWLGRQLSRALQGGAEQSAVGENLVERPGVGPLDLPAANAQDALPL